MQWGLSTRLMEGPQLQKSIPLVLVLGFALGIVLLIGSACCSTQKNYEVLTFFFDDVPAAGSPEFKSGLSARAPASRSASRNAPETADSQPAGSPPTVKEFLHKPFAENKCSDCHSAGLSMMVSQDNAQLCVQCHRDFVKPFKFLHAPVVEFQCYLCHQAHSSQLPHLLSGSESSLCYSCHNEVSVLKARYHQNIDVQKCSSCHDPHGGENRMFLKQGSSANAGAIASSRPGGT